MPTHRRSTVYPAFEREGARLAVGYSCLVGAAINEGESKLTRVENYYRIIHSKGTDKKWNCQEKFF